MVNRENIDENYMIKYTVQISEIKFVNTGEDGKPEPYGYIDLYYQPSPALGEEKVRIWEETNSSSPPSVEVITGLTFNIKATSLSELCFVGSVRESDAWPNGDDVIAYPNRVCGGMNGTIKLKGESPAEENHVQIKYKVIKEDTLPTAPKNLSSSAHTISTIDLEWEKSMDDIEIIGYVIYQDQNEIKTVDSATTAYTIRGLQPDTSYIYSIKAKSINGNFSEPSNTITVKTEPDTMYMISIMTHNMYFLASPTDVNQKLRAKNTILPSSYYRYSDIIILEELFEDEATGILLEGMEKYGNFNFRTPVLGEGGLDIQRGGVAILSKWPIVKYEKHIFNNRGCGVEGIQNKGVMYAKINVNGTYIHVFGTHTQSDISFIGCDGPLVRKKQLQELANFIEKKNIPFEEYVVIGGDFNINLYDQENYNYLIEVLNVIEPNYTGHPYTWDKDTNLYASYSDPDGKNEHLDFILLRTKHRLPPENWGNYSNIVEQVKVVDSECNNVCNQMIQNDRKNIDFSDHYPVKTLIPIEKD
nr:pesticidal crystal protein Orf2Ab [Bacillus thuringiensis]